MPNLKKTVALLACSLLIGTSTSIANAEEIDFPSSQKEESVNPNNQQSITITPASGESIEKSIKTAAGNQFEWSIKNNEAKHSRTFKVDSDGKVDLSIDENSGAIIVKVDGEPQALINAPWAKDRNEDSVKTHFEVDGDTFTQHVEELSDPQKYPITADPSVNWGIISGHIYFSKDETRKVGASTAAAFAITPFWTLVPPPYGEALGVWWGLHAAEVTGWAAAAAAQDKCLALKVGATGSIAPKTSLGVTPEHYTEGCS